MDWFNLKEDNIYLSFWQKIRLVFIPMQYSIDWTSKYEATVIGFKILDGKIVILSER